MKRRSWDSKTKAKIVLEGLQGRALASLCREYGISQSMYYRWRNILLANAQLVFEADATARREKALAAENNKLKKSLAEARGTFKKRG